MNTLINYQDKIFIAGSTGMVGSSIKKALLKKGYGNRALGGEILSPKRSELDLTNFKLLEEWIKKNKPSVVIIAAAKVGGIFANSSKPFDFILENLKIQTNLIEISWKFGVRRLLFLGSSCIYPKYAAQPIKEESLLTGLLEETNESYAIAKIAGIKLCQGLRKQYGFDAICLMPTNLYGTGDNYNLSSSHVLPALIRKFIEAKIRNESKVICWGTGSPLREFLHVNDLADACIFALERWDPSSKNAPLNINGRELNYLNVGTGKDISIRDLANLIKDLTNYKGSIVWDQSKPDGTPKKQLNIDKFSFLGWKAKISLETGLKLTIDEFSHKFKIN